MERANVSSSLKMTKPTMFTHFHLSYSINVKQMQNIWLPFCHRRNFGYVQYEMSIPIFGGSTFFIPIKLDLVTAQCGSVVAVLLRVPVGLTT